jgi:hypothetical protein
MRGEFAAARAKPVESAPMADESPDDTVARLAAEIHEFLRAFPDHFASRALLDVIARDAGGEGVPADERMLALTTVVQELRRRRTR